MSLDKDISKLEENLRVVFKDKRILHQALVHRSYLNEHPQFELGHNERLEFLGDAVLELVVTEYLYLKYDNPEGELTNWRASLVNAKMLSDVSAGLGVNEYLYLSKGEASDANSKARQYILANAFEAIVGAMYLDQGWDVSKEFIHRVILSRLSHILEHKLYMDPKSRFQEEAQERIGKTPRYEVLSESGPDHAKEFVVGVFVNGDKIAEGRGTSKQEAQVDAAQNALDTKGW
ncbi:MAG: ribonuclease III [Patescibacteria group bacterium]|jgi:ribonuclease-3